MFKSKQEIIDCFDHSDNDLKKFLYPNYNINQVEKENVVYYLTPKV